MRGNLKRKIAGFVFIFVVCLVTSQLPAVEFAGGTGEPNDPYQIATAEQLQAIGDSTLNDKCFMLIADIDLDPNLPGNDIISNRRFIESFDGILDGNGHSISNLVIESYYIGRGSFTEYMGLISFSSSDTVVKDIQLQNITILGDGHEVGALVGSNKGKVLRCSVTGSISGTSRIGALVGDNEGDVVSCSSFCNVKITPTQYSDIVWAAWAAGGLVGTNYGYISNCYATGTVTGDKYLGGLVGGNDGCISNCYATGTVTGEEIVAGLAGFNDGFIYNCYTIGTVTGEEYVGGLIGVNYNYVSNCYAVGTVTGEKSVGGLVGNNSDESYLCRISGISQCYAACEVIADSNDSIGGLIGKSAGQTTDSFWDIQVSGQKISAGGIGLPTAKLQDSGTYLNAGWDMTEETSNGLADIWTITEPNAYPQLTRLTDQYSITQLAGSGTEDDPYKIATAEELVAINDYDIDAHYILVADIDMSGIVWATAPIFFFDGTLDGRGHTISNLTIKGDNYLGLFGEIMINGVITNLTIKDAYIVGHERVGALAGDSYGHITNCHVTGNVTGVYSVGGLVGLVNIPCFTALEDYVSDCSADVILSGNDEVDNIANVDFYG
jgi:hypothetical protein